MNRIISLIVAGIIALAAYAHGNSSIMVSYTAHSINLRDGKTELKIRYILLANASGSKFFSPVSEYVDSMNSTSRGRAKLQQMTATAVQDGKLADIPRRDGACYVVKSLDEGRLKHYDYAGTEQYVYEEPTGQCEWSVADSVRTILDYECIMATTDYHGRKWTVWFSPEIPVRNGPWKFDGLPGLILEAESEDGHYGFVATGIEECSRPIGPVYLADEYEKTERIDYLKAKRASLDNPMGALNALSGSGKVVMMGADGKPVSSRSMFVPASIADFIETDYH